MAGDGAAPELFERLLRDAAFRAAFRADPANALRAAGLSQMAEELGDEGPGKALETLEIRESRSSLAGAMMAALVEGIDIAGPHSAANAGAAFEPNTPASGDERADGADGGADDGGDDGGNGGGDGG